MLPDPSRLPPVPSLPSVEQRIKAALMAVKLIPVVGQNGEQRDFRLRVATRYFAGGGDAPCRLHPHDAQPSRRALTWAAPAVTRSQVSLCARAGIASAMRAAMRWGRSMLVSNARMQLRVPRWGGG